MAPKGGVFFGVPMPLTVPVLAFSNPTTLTIPTDIQHLLDTGVIHAVACSLCWCPNPTSAHAPSGFAAYVRAGISVALATGTGGHTWTSNAATLYQQPAVGAACFSLAQQAPYLFDAEAIMGAWTQAGAHAFSVSNTTATLTVVRDGVFLGLEHAEIVLEDELNTLMEDIHDGRAPRFDTGALLCALMVRPAHPTAHQCLALTNKATRALQQWRAVYPEWDALYDPLYGFKPIPIALQAPSCEDILMAA